MKLVKVQIELEIPNGDMNHCMFGEIVGGVYTFRHDNANIAHYFNYKLHDDPEWVDRFMEFGPENIVEVREFE